MSDGKLIIAVPSKGRLQENANAFFARAGLDVTRPGGDRDYRGRMNGLEDVEVTFLSAAEIAGELALGNVHLGVTGRDQIEEGIDNFNARIDLTLPLGFGRCDVVVAVPEAWIDVHSMADIDDIAAEFRSRHGRRLLVATKYLHLTRRFFAEHGVVDYRIVESLGATEGAPTSGAADLIVDITTTGAKLRANSLKILDDGLILSSEAHLAASLTATWGVAARRGLRTVLDRIAAESTARNLSAISAEVTDPEAAAKSAAKLFRAETPFGVGRPLVLHVSAGKANGCVDWLRSKAGATTVAVSPVDSVFTAESPIYDRLIGRLP